jgi:hypothetical protein
VIYCWPWEFGTGEVRLAVAVRVVAGPVGEYHTEPIDYAAAITAVNGAAPVLVLREAPSTIL